MGISRFIITALALEHASVLCTADALETKTNSGLSLSVTILAWVSFCPCILLRSNVHNITTYTTFAKCYCNSKFYEIKGITRKLKEILIIACLN